MIAKGLVLRDITKCKNQLENLSFNNENNFENVKS